MRALLRLMVVITGIALVGFAVHDVASLGMGVFSSVARAPQQFWNALGQATTWGIGYKIGATVAFIVCLAVLYVSRVPPVRGK